MNIHFLAYIFWYNIDYLHRRYNLGYTIPEVVNRRLKHFLRNHLDSYIEPHDQQPYIRHRDHIVLGHCMDLYIAC